MRASGVHGAQAAVNRRRRRSQVDDEKKRLAHAEALVHLRELSLARQVLEGVQLAPGSRKTLNKLTDKSKRLRELRVPVPPDHRPRGLFNLDDSMFLRNLRSVRRGTAGGPALAAVVPFVSVFSGSASSYLWEDDSGPIRLSRAKLENRGTQRCPCCSHWGNIQRWKRCRPSCSKVRSCLRTWTTSTSSPLLNAQVQCMRSSRMHFGTTLGFVSTKAKPKSGQSRRETCNLRNVGARGNSSRSKSQCLAWV